MAAPRAANLPIYVGPPVQHTSRKTPVIYVGPPLSNRERRPGVPADYAEFAEAFYSRIKAQVAGFPGIDRSEAEDITQTIVMQFIAGDYLNIYSAEKQGQYAEARYQEQLRLYQAGELEFAPVRFEGRFSSFVFEFVKRRLMGIRDKTNRRQMLMRSLDTYFEVESVENGEQEPSLLSFIGTVEGEFQNIELRQILQRAYLHLSQITTPTPTRDFPQLFLQSVGDGMNRPEGFDREAYAVERGITVSAVSMQLREMRLYLEQWGLYREFHELVAKRDKQSGYACY